MRLLEVQPDGIVRLTKDLLNDIPPYAILSHTWGGDDDEVTFQDLNNGTGTQKPGFRKIGFCRKQALSDGLRYFWIDTCCIDKSSSAELQEAIISMFRWYQQSAKCYVYLSDVSANEDADETRSTWKLALRKSRWFTRGWTLQELLAPSRVDFYSSEGERLGSKDSMGQLLSEITGIPVDAIQGLPLCEFSIDQRMSWANSRQTKREEDMAYSMLGIFGVSMSAQYGELKWNAMARLHREIRERIDPHWTPSERGTSSPQVGNAHPGEQLQELVQRLAFDQMLSRLSDIRPPKNHTCGWILDAEKYKDWKDMKKLRDHHGFLWIKGKPGAGKSTMMKYLFSNSKRTIRNARVISFFFHARGNKLEKSTEGLYRSLLFQLLNNNVGLQETLFDMDYDITRIVKSEGWQPQVLKDALYRVFEGLGTKPLLCYIDALDECPEDEIRDMLSFFEDICTQALDTNVRFNICFSSRHYPHITVRHGINMVLEHESQHQSDMETYIDTELRIRDVAEFMNIKNIMLQKASGVFLWIVLVVTILNKAFDRSDNIRRKLDEIPSKLGDLFRDIILRDNEDRSELLVCVQWILFSNTPMLLSELYIATQIHLRDTGTAFEFPQTKSADTMLRRIVHMSKGLVEQTFAERPTMQFIHESVRDFLIKDNGLQELWPDLGPDFEAQTQGKLAKCCLRQLQVNIEDILHISSKPPPRLPETNKLRDEILSIFPFADYAKNNVLQYADAAQAQELNQLPFMQEFSLKHWLKVHNWLVLPMTHRYPNDTSGLYLLADLGLVNLIRIHPERCIHDKFYGGRNKYPLLAAAMSRKTETIRYLGVEIYEEEGFEVSSSDFKQEHSQILKTSLSGFRNLIDKQDRKPLVWHLLRLGYISTAFNILCYGILRYDDRRSHLGLRTLFDAAKQEIPLALSFLLDYLSSGWFKLLPLEKRPIETPLEFALQRCSANIIILLLQDKELVLDYTDEIDQKILSWAAMNDNREAVQFLINTRRGYLDSIDSIGRTPLSYAAGSGSTEIVKSLLETNQVQPHLADCFGRTPLSYATESGNIEIVKSLLKTNQLQLHLADTWGRTPLSYAAGIVDTNIFKLLLKTNQVQLDLVDRWGRTPLSYAAAIGNAEIVKILLETNQNQLDLADSLGRTPLLYAAGMGNTNIFKLLLKTNQVQLDLADGCGRTPLSWAVAKAGNEKIVKILLETNQIQPDLADRQGRTPLSWAVVEAGNEKIVKILLETNQIQPDLADRQGRTALSDTTDNSSMQTSKLLPSVLRVQLDSCDDSGYTPLMYALMSRNYESAKLLLETGLVSLHSLKEREPTRIVFEHIDLHNLALHIYESK